MTVNIPFSDNFARIRKVNNKNIRATSPQEKYMELPEEPIYKTSQNCAQPRN